MKILSILIFVCLLLASCGNNKADQPLADADTATMTPPVYRWQAFSNDSNGRLEMKKIEAAKSDTLSPAAVANYLNQTNSNVQLVLIKTSGDTVYLKIPEATYLTQQMGSTGSVFYLAQAVYNLTEIPGIKYVNLDFEEGDHASPGTYTREDFKNE